MTHDRIGYNTPTTFNGIPMQMDTADEIVVDGCDVHIEMLDDDVAMLHLERDGRQVHGSLVAVPLSGRDRRRMRRRRGECLTDLIRGTLTGRIRYLDTPWWRVPAAIVQSWRGDTPKAALLITVEDDELGIGEQP